MTCEAFSSGQSLLHKTDPRVKILIATAFSVVVACLNNLALEVFALGSGFVLVLLARLPFKSFWTRVGAVNIFILALWVIMPFTTPGHVIYSIGPLDITREGIFQTLSITLKCNAILFVNLALLSTSTIFSLAHALSHMKVPKKLVQLFFFSWRYLHVLEGEYNRMQKALKIRGFTPGTNLHTYRTYAYLVGLLFIRGYDRGDRVYKAMLCRGFNGTFWLLQHFHLHWRDILLGLVMGAIILGLAGMEWIKDLRLYP